MTAPAALRRRLSTGLLTVYGIGVMVGAGIYVLVGTIAGHAGIWAPAAFLAAGVIAAFSALSYAELSARIPHASGAAAFVEKGLASPALGRGTGLAVVLAGIVSGAAVLRGGAGYLTALAPLPDTLAIPVLGLVLTAIAIFGVLESLTFAALLTLVEVSGLLLVTGAGLTAAPSPDWLTAAAPATSGLLAATGLAFFAFIGFEDMANMSEEAKDPARGVPRAIVAALACTAVLYALVAFAAVRAVPVADLAASERPLALVWQAAGGGAVLLSAIAVAAALNGVLAQVIMAARVLYGLGRTTPALAIFHHVGPRTGTPARATAAAGAAVILAAMALPVERLATITTAILLVVFMLVNLALIRLHRDGSRPAFRVPGWVPRAGIASSAAALAATLWGAA